MKLCLACLIGLIVTACGVTTAETPVAQLTEATPTTLPVISAPTDIPTAEPTQVVAEAAKEDLEPEGITAPAASPAPVEDKATPAEGVN